MDKPILPLFHLMLFLKAAGDKYWRFQHWVNPCDEVFSTHKTLKGLAAGVSNNTDRTFFFACFPFLKPVYNSDMVALLQLQVQQHAHSNAECKPFLTSKEQYVWKSGTNFYNFCHNNFDTLLKGNKWNSNSSWSIVWTRMVCERTHAVLNLPYRNAGYGLLALTTFNY